MNEPRSAQTISIVVPLYNEQENIRSLYARLTDVLDRLRQPYEVIFVDDGSRDQTGKFLDEICEKDARVTVVRLRRNFGQAAALSQRHGGRLRYRQRLAREEARCVADSAIAQPRRELDDGQAFGREPPRFWHHL